MKFGIYEVIHPLSTEKVLAERKLYVAGKIKDNVEKVSQSVKIEDDKQPVSECLKAIKELREGNSDYAAVEFFTDKTGITRMNICHMRTVK